MSTKSASTVNAENRSFKIDDFVLDKEIIGKGKYGEVYIAREKRTGFTVALKAIHKTKIANPRLLRYLKQEIELQYHLNHPHIVVLYAFFTDPECVYLVLEHCLRGDLGDVLIANPNGISHHRAAFYTDCIADALQYCQERNVMHRDVKPDNILLDKRLHPKLADFGLAVQSFDELNHTLCGTTEYMAPEMITSSRRNGYNRKIDNWALGILFYACLTGNEPFEGENLDKKICEGKIPKNRKIPNWAWILIQGLCKVNAERRLELTEFRKHKSLRSLVAYFNTLY